MAKKKARREATRRPDYTVEWTSISSIKPSPENDELYGVIEHDDQMVQLCESIGHRGLAEPITVSADDYIMSGHRRYFACHERGFREIPVRREKIKRADHLHDWHRILAEYNPQRIKTTATLLKEAMLRFSDADSWDALREHRETSIIVDAEFLEVGGCKFVPDITPPKEPFLAAARSVIFGTLREFWPLSVRQIHYQLLNDPPLITVVQRSIKPAEHYRYRNDRRSYKALIDLLKRARYNGHMPMDCIDDPTRPCFRNNGWRNAAEYIEYEVRNFLCGYHRDRQIDQPRHIEVLGEKNTLLGILKPICKDYYVPLSLGRGYGSIPTWRNMARRFVDSGKDAMTLIVASDYDPEGFDLADDAIRSLRDLFGIPVDYHRVGVNEEQIEELELFGDFNPAKEESSRLESFIERTGGTDTWELESLPPEYLQEQLRAAIEANMDMGIWQGTLDQEEGDLEVIAEARAEIAASMGL